MPGLSGALRLYQRRPSGTATAAASPAGGLTAAAGGATDAGVSPGLCLAVGGGSHHLAGGAAAAIAPESLSRPAQGTIAGSGDGHRPQLLAPVCPCPCGAAWHHVGLASGALGGSAGAAPMGGVRERLAVEAGIAFASRVLDGR